MFGKKGKEKEQVGQFAVSLKCLVRKRNGSLWNHQTDWIQDAHRLRSNASGVLPISV